MARGPGAPWLFSLLSARNLQRAGSPKASIRCCYHSNAAILASLSPKPRQTLEWRCRRGIAAQRSKETAVTQRDSERIARQWNREIEDEIRREAERSAGARRWKAVSWAAMWLLWLALLAALLAHIHS